MLSHSFNSLSRNLISVYFFLALSFCAISAESATLVLQEGTDDLTGTEAAYFSSSDVNYEYTSKLYFRYNSPNALYFPIEDNLPAGSTISSATLEVYVYEEYNSGTKNIQCGYITDPNNTGLWHDRGGADGNWWAATMAMKEAQTGIYWNNAQNYFTSVMSSMACGQTNVITTGWKSWTTTTVVQSWWNGTYPNRGFWLREASGANSNASASGKYDGTTSRHPKLTITYTPPANPPASAPTLNSPTAAGSQSIGLSWSSVSNVDGYKVRYGTSSGNYTTTVDVGKTTQYNVTGLTNGTTYYFTVAAYNYAGDGPNATEQSVTAHYMPPSDEIVLQEGVDDLTGTEAAALSTLDVNNEYSNSLIFRWNFPNALYFPVSAYVPDGSTIHSATLEVYVYDEYNTSLTNVECGYITDPDDTGLWHDLGSATEGGWAATMAKKEGATSVYWNNAHDQFTSVMSSIACGQANVQTTGWKIWDTTTVVQAWSSETYANRGFWLREASGSNSNARALAKYLGDAPKLTIDYTPPLTPPENAVTLNTPTSGSQSVSLSWDSVSDADGYKVKYGTTSGTYTTTVDVGNTTQHAFNNLSNGITYFFVVTAYNLAGDGENSNEMSATPQVPAPGAPVLSSVVSNNQAATLSWQATSGAAGYRIYYGTASGTYGATPVEAGAVTSLQVTGLTNGTIYYFVVTAYNAGGESGVSNEISGTPQVPAPSAPVLSNVASNNQAATPSWQSVSGATGYKIYYGTTSGTYGTPIDAENVTSFQVTGLTNETTYYFAVSAYNAGGESAVSNEISAVPQNPAPSAPTLNSAVAASTQATLSWDSVANATGYKVKYGTTSGSYTTTVDAGAVTNNIVTGLTNDTAYYFVVTAYNVGGESGNSNELSATPWQVTATYGADQCTGGTSTASSCHQGCGNPTYTHSNAFNDNLSSGWTTAGTRTGWLEYQFGSPKTIAQYTIYYPSGFGSHPADWTFEAYDSGTSQWVVLDTRVNQDWTDAATKVYPFSNSNAYTRYRINVSANGGHVDLAIVEMEMMELATPGAPSAVSNLTATAGDTAVTLNWNQPADNGSAITDYKVEYGTVASGQFTSTYYTGTGTPGATISSLTNFTEYQFRVTAINAYGTSLVSNVATTMPFHGTIITGGTLTSNTTWTFAGSTYLIYGNVTVNPGVTLTIEPGVQVRFMGNYKLEGSGPIKALGTAEQPIVFTSGQASPARGNWNAIILKNDKSYFNYTQIEYADKGIYVHQDIAGNKNPFIQNSQIQNNNYGIYSEVGTSPNILSNTITNNGTGIYASCYPGCSPRINKNSIYSNTNYSVYTYSSNTNASYVNIDATYNWWGTTVTSEIAASIWDWTDWNYLPHVNYTPFLTTTPEQSIHITNNSVSVKFVNMRSVSATNINYTIDKAANITIKIFNQANGTLVRTLLNSQSRSVGNYSESWDLKNDSAQLLSAGLYTYMIEAAAVDGTADVYGPDNVPANDPLISNATITPSTTFSPAKGDRMVVQFTLDQPASVSMGFEDSLFVTDKILNAGSNVLYWEGWDTSGLQSFYLNTVNIDMVAKRLPETAIILDSGVTLEISSALADPYMIRPLYNEITTLSYTLNESADVTISILTPDGATVLNTLENNVAKTAGSHTVVWDGRDSNGATIVDAGYYRARIQAQDSHGSVVTRTVSIRVLY